MKRLPALAERKPQRAAEHAPEAHPPGQSITTPAPDVGQQSSKREQKPTPQFATRLQRCIGFPAPVVGEINSGKNPVGGIERLVEQPDPERAQSQHSQPHEQQLARSIPNTAQAHAEKHTTEPDPQSTLDRQPEHSPAQRRPVPDQLRVMRETNRLAISHRTAQSHRDRTPRHGARDRLRICTRTEQERQHQSHRQARHHRPGLVAILAANAPRHSARHRPEDYGLPHGNRIQRRSRFANVTHLRGVSHTAHWQHDQPIKPEALSPRARRHPSGGNRARHSDR